MNDFKTTVNQTIIEVCGEAKRKKDEWMNNKVMMLVEQKQKAFSKWQKRIGRSKEKREKLYQSYKNLNKAWKKEAKQAKTVWWCNKVDEMEKAAQRKDTRALYKFIEELNKPEAKKDEPLLDEKRERVCNRTEKLNIWKIHFEKLLNAGKNIDQQVIERLDVPSSSTWTEPVPTIDEIKTAVKKLNNNKAAGIDELRAEYIKGEEKYSRSGSKRSYTWFGAREKFQETG